MQVPGHIARGGGGEPTNKKECQNGVVEFHAQNSQTSSQKAATRRNILICDIAVVWGSRCRRQNRASSSISSKSKYVNGRNEIYNDKMK